MLFERTCREYGITARLTTRRSPTTTGKTERFHRSLRRELLDETGAFDTIEAAQAAIDEWVHAYNSVRPHQSLNMAAPASLFRSRSTDPDSAPSTPIDAEKPIADRPAPTVADRSGSAVEFDAVVPPSGVVTIAGTQQVWVGKNHAQRTVVMWADLSSVHVISDDTVITTVLSKLTTADLQRLRARGTRPGRPTPATAAVDTSTATHQPRAIEIDRTANRDGIVRRWRPRPRPGWCPRRRKPHHASHRRRPDPRDQRHPSDKTLPNPLDLEDIRRLTGVREASTPLPPAPPSGPQSVHRRLPTSGQIMVAGQRLRVSPTYTGTIVAVIVDDHHLRVLDGTKELSHHARTTTKAIHNFNAHRR